MTATAAATSDPVAQVTIEAVAVEALDMLQQMQRRQPWSWWTPNEVHNCLGRWARVTVRHALRHLAAAGLIEARVGGTDERPFREYRARG